jgi:hypothetical protein
LGGVLVPVVVLVVVAVVVVLAWEVVLFEEHYSSFVLPQIMMHYYSFKYSIT